MRESLAETKREIGDEKTEVVRYRRFLPEDEYVASFTGGVVPPFLVFQPFVIRDGIKGYMVPCKPEESENE